MPNRAVIYVQPGTVPHDRQAQACAEFCRARGFEVVAVVPPHGAADAVEMVTAGRAGLIVSAFAARHRPGDIRDLAADAGVRLEYVRPPVVRRDVAEIIAHAYGRERDVRRVADLLGITTGGVRAALSRLGIRVPRQGNGTTPDSRE
jgi:hypothetical protein